VFQVFGAPKNKINVCGRVMAGGCTHTHWRREGCSIEHVFGRLEETAGAAATGCIGSGLSLGSWRAEQKTGPRSTMQTA
jgi:hypothetical protein